MTPYTNLTPILRLLAAHRASTNTPPVSAFIDYLLADGNEELAGDRIAAYYILLPIMFTADNDAAMELSTDPTMRLGATMRLLSIRLELDQEMREQARVKAEQDAARSVAVDEPTPVGS